MFLSGRESKNRVNSVYFYLPKRKVLRGDVACRTSPREPQADASSLWPAGEHGSSLGLSECRLDCSSHPHSILTHPACSHTQHAHTPSMLTHTAFSPTQYSHPHSMLTHTASDWRIGWIAQVNGQIKRTCNPAKKGMGNRLVSTAVPFSSAARIERVWQSLTACL